MSPSVTDMPLPTLNNKGGELNSTFFKVRVREEKVIQEAKQRASIKWLLMKSYNNKPPDELKDPFYRDHDDLERLKPHVVHALANAELYCMALSHLYADPNYHNLNHWGIIQALARKGVYVAEPPDCALTETVLIQTTPLKMTAHMAVMEALMALFVKEQVTPDRVVSAVRRFSKMEEVPGDQEEALLMWIHKSCQALREKVRAQLEEKESLVPSFSSLQDLSDLSDGVCLAGLICLYCPEDLEWTEIALGDPASMADSLYNIRLVQRFTAETLENNINHLTIEDIVYMHSSIKSNLVCFLADLFTVLECAPARCVKLPGARTDQIIEMPDPDIRSKSADMKRQNSMQDKKTSRLSLQDGPRSSGGSYSAPLTRPDSRSDRDTSGDESFVVQRGRTIPTLSSVAQSHRSESPGSDRGQKERLNQDTKSEERGETDNPPSLTRSNSVFDQVRSIQAAGRPSEPSPRRGGRESFAGRRSRRNSTDDNQSQISLENIGGSQENLSVLARNPDKEMRTHTGKKQEVAIGSLRRGSANQQTFDIRKSSTESNPDNEIDNRFLDNKELDAMEKHQQEESSKGGKESVNLNTSFKEDKEKKMSFADLRRKSQNQFATSGINITYSEGDEKEDQPKRTTTLLRRDSQRDKNGSGAGTPVRSWGQANSQQNQNNPDEMNAQLNTVRQKLEERRKRIEEEKRKMEVVMSRQREKEVNDDISAVQSKWLSDRTSTEPVKTPDMEGMDMDTYTKSLTTMNDSLYELQSDIQKLAQQQTQIKKMMSPTTPPATSQQQPPGIQPSGHQPPPVHQPPGPTNSMDPQPFYISQPESAPMAPQRRTWGQPQPISFAGHHGPVMGPGQPPYDPRRWGGQHNGPRPPMYGAPYQQFDQYGQPIVPRDQWGNPLPQGPMYNGGQPAYDAYGYAQPYNQQPYGAPYGGQGPYGPGPTYSPYSPAPPPPQQQPTPPHYPSTLASPSQPEPAARGTPFRLHDSSASPGPRNTSLSEPSSSSTPRPGFSRQSSRDNVPSQQSSPNLPRRIHAPVPAPDPDDMAPQNVSFIDSSTDDDKKAASPPPAARSDSSLSDRLSRLNISRGDKTYRVQLHADGREPTCVAAVTSPPSPARTTRPTISSTFKERRRGSGEASGASSMSGPASVPTVQNKMTEEEAETLGNMKTEVLKETADPSKGFVISFDDDTPKKPKPVLKQRRFSKKNSLTDGLADLGPLSAKENVPPDSVMIMLDMNDGDDVDNRGVSPNRKMSPGQRMGSPSRYIDPSQWNSFGEEQMGGDPVIPKFDVDPDVPLERMIPLKDPHQTTESDSDGGKQNGGTGMIIGNEMLEADPVEIDDMARKKERIMMQSLRRKQQAEENRIKREEEARRRREEEAVKLEEAERKKEEEKKRKEAILEQHRIKKEMEKAEEEGRRYPAPVAAKAPPKMRPKSGVGSKPRPKTICGDKDDLPMSTLRNRRGSQNNITGVGASTSNLRRSESRGSVAESDRGDRERPASGRSTLSLAGMGSRDPRPVGLSGIARPSTSTARNSSIARPSTSRPPSRGPSGPSRWGSSSFINDDNTAHLPPAGPSGRTPDTPSRVARRQNSMNSMAEDSPRMSRLDRSSRSISQPRGKRESSVSSAYGDDHGHHGHGLRKDSFRGSRDSLTSRLTYTKGRRGSNASMYDEEHDYYYGGSLRDLSHGGHSGRRKSSSASYLGPGSLPPGSSRFRHGGGDFDDGASDISSTMSGYSAYGSRSGGTRLFKEPSSKSNRPIIMNAVEFAVFPGVVNRQKLMDVLDEIDRCDCPHFLLLFRDAKCQFRGLYAYYPDTEEVFKIHGVGPKQVTNNMFEKYFKYNSGGKKFTQIHTKNLTMTIDAFTIHNSLWLGKKGKLPDKRDMALVV